MIFYPNAVIIDRIDGKEVFVLTLNKKINIKIWLSAGLVTIMVFLSEILMENEIIFPETAALVIGAWLSPKHIWRTSREKMLLFMSIAAGAGYYISAYIEEAPLYLKIVVGMLVCMALVLISQTTMLPLISACILPILTEVNNIIYPLSVIILTAVVAGGQILLEKKKLKKVYRYKPIFYDVPLEIKRWTFIIIVMAVMTGFALHLDIRFIIAPPLIVAFCEFTYHKSSVRKIPVPVLIMTTLAAFLGAFSRMLLCTILNLPLTVVVFGVIMLVLYTMKMIKVYFPPAGAIAILPFIIGETELYFYPVEIMLGGIVFITLAMVFGKLVKATPVPKKAVLPEQHTEKENVK